MTIENEEKVTIGHIISSLEPLANVLKAFYNEIKRLDPSNRTLLQFDKASTSYTYAEYVLDYRKCANNWKDVFLTLLNDMALVHMEFSNSSQNYGFWAVPDFLDNPLKFGVILCDKLLMSHKPGHYLIVDDFNIGTYATLDTNYNWDVIWKYPD